MLALRTDRDDRKGSRGRPAFWRRDLEEGLRARRSPRKPTLLAFLGFLLATNADARVMEWQGTLSLELIGIPISETLSVEGAGIAAVNPGDLSLQWIRFGGGISGTTTFIVTDPDVAGGGIAGIQATPQLGSGTIRVAASPTLFEPLLSERLLPLRGTVRLCLLSTSCTLFLPLDLTAGSGTRGIGIGGLVTAGGYGQVRISVQAAPWTMGTASFPVFTTEGSLVTLLSFGDAHGPFSFTGSTLFATPSGHGGALQLVTPIRVSSNENFEQLSGFGRLDIRFIPEPGFFLLAGSGSGGLLLLSLARRRGIRPGQR